VACRVACPSTRPRRARCCRTGIRARSRSTRSLRRRGRASTCRRRSSLSSRRRSSSTTSSSTRILQVTRHTPHYTPHDTHTIVN
jgi:hypothetical protein